MQLEDDPRPTPPPRPADDACCGRGCMHCVFDVYDDSMARYERLLREWEARHSPEPAQNIRREDQQ